MKIKRNKRGSYQKDNSTFNVLLLAVITVGIVLIIFSYHLFTIIF